MARLYLVRNARTDEGTGFEANPGLDGVGRVQAEAVAALLGSLPRMSIVTSPQKRAVETAQVLAERWMGPLSIDPALTLMPLPPGDAGTTLSWLTTFMKSNWADAPQPQAEWRRNCLARLSVAAANTVVVSHFIVVNMIVGAALADDRVTVFQPDNGSITIVDAQDGRLRLVEMGRQAATRRL